MIDTSLGHYTLREVLGEGGMGTVYRARDTRLHRDVAIKLLTGVDVDSPVERERLLEEARAAAQINHPSIATVYEVAELDGHSFIVMELVPGSPLSHHVGELSGKGPELVRLALAAVRALGAAHDEGVVHGDIKPDNLMKCPDGSLKILDFGVSRRLAQRTLQTIRTAPRDMPSPATEDQRAKSGAIAGTIAYMSREQMRGETIDGRADLYSLGVVLQELCTGRLPFDGSNANVVIARATTADTAVLDDLHRNQPADSVRVIERLLALDPQDRYGSAHDVAVDLEVVLASLDRQDSLPAHRGKVVAVLPFRLLAGTDEDDFLGVGLAQAVAHGLAGEPSLAVRPMSAVVGYAGASDGARRAASDLTADLVVEGTIQRVGERLRVQVQAWDSKADATLFSALEDGSMDTLFAVQDRLSRTIAQGLGAEEPRRDRTGGLETDIPSSSEAYELYLRAGERILRISDYDVRSAIDQLERCVRLEPEFSDAWSRLAGAQVLMAVLIDPDEKWYAAAERSVDRALVLDPGSPEAWTVRGRLLWSPRASFAHEDGLRYLSAACHHTRRPHDAAVWYAIVLAHVGLHDESREWFDRALANQPEDALAQLTKAEVASYQGDFAGAAEIYLRLFTTDPANIFTRVFLPVGLAYAGELDEAFSHVGDARRLLGDDTLLDAAEALIEALRGDSARAKVLLGAATGRPHSASHYHHTLHYAAAAYAVIGSGSEAVELLSQAANHGLPNYPAFRDDPHFQALAGRPDFIELMSDLEIRWHHLRSGFGAGGVDSAEPRTGSSQKVDS